MVKSIKPFLWIEELTHLKQGLFLSMEDQRPPSSPVSVSKNIRKTAAGPDTWAGYRKTVWQGGQQGAQSCLIYAREPFTPSWLQGRGYQRTVSKRRAQWWTLLKRTVSWVSLPIVYTDHFSSWKMSRNLGFWFSSLSHFQTLWENQALVVSTHENPTSYRGSLKYWRHILGRGSTSPSRSFIFLLWKSSMFIMKWNETFC